MRLFRRLTGNAVFATQCLLCGAVAGNRIPNICDDCLAALPRLSTTCPLCAVPVPTGHRCPACQSNPPPFSRTVAAFNYAQPVSRLITMMKFRGKLSVVDALAPVLADAIRARYEKLPDCVIPVPLHRSRLRQRGFNQSQELAQALADQLGGLQLATLVERVHATAPQTSLDHPPARRRNVLGAFAARTSSCPHVAIVDDVMTTGSTVAEVARTLRRAGVGEVDVWVCARATLR